MRTKLTPPSKVKKQIEIKTPKGYALMPSVCGTNPPEAAVVIARMAASKVLAPARAIDENAARVTIA